MSEMEDLLAVFGGVDIAVQSDATGESRARVAALLPRYESPELHWYSDFLEWRREEGVELPESVGETLQSVALALQNLADTEPGSNRLAARRLLALYVLTQAGVNVFGPDAELGNEVQGALAPVLRQRLELGEAGEGRANEAARLLHEFMAEDHPTSVGQDADERWSELVSQVRLYVYVSGLESRPCTGRLKTRPGVKGPVATLESVFDVHDVDFDRVRNFLVPENWPRCMDFWCEMEPVPGVPAHIHRYNELVSTRCPGDRAVFTMRAVLDFKFISQSNAAISKYTLAEVEQPPDGPLVDEGALIVSRMRGFLRVNTTKAVKFNRAFSGEQLAMIACALGWTEKGKDMMYNCARLPEDDLQRTRRDPARVSSGGEFPGRIVHGAPRRSAPRRATRVSSRSASSRATSGSRRRPTRDGALASDIARQTAEAIKDCVDEQVAYLERWADRIDDDDYGYDDMADDMARAGVRAIFDSAKIMDLATRNVRLVGASARTGRAARRAHAGAPDDEEEGSS